MRKTAVLLSLVTASPFGFQIRIDQPLAPVQFGAVTKFGMRMRTMALLLVLAAMPALSEIRNDQPLTPVQFGAAPASQEYARVASDGTNFFAAWRTYTASNAVVIGGGRLSPSGELLDRPSILIASGTTLGNFDVVFVGGSFLVVYQSGASLMARRVSREGRFVDPQPVVINNTTMYGPLATNGDNALLRTSAKTFRMLAADGTPLGAERVVPNAGIYTASVASNGSQYLIAYVSDYLSRGSFTIFNSKGDVEVSSKFPISVPDYVDGITVTSNGSSFLMTMIVSARIYCMTVDSAGNTGPLTTTGYQTVAPVVATWSGSDYTLAWPISRSYSPGPSNSVLAARIDAAGELLDPAPVPITPSQDSRWGHAFAIASNGGDTIIITGELNSSGWRTTATIFKSLPQIDSEPAARRHAAIASSSPEQAGGSIASNGTLSMVAWREHTGVDTVVRATFIAADGQLGAPIDLGDAHPHTRTATASNGRDFVVAYFDAQYRLVARRVSLEGVLDRVPIVINPHANPEDAMPPYAEPEDAIAIGWSGQAYLAVTAGAAVTIASIAQDGTTVLPATMIGNEPADSPALSCAANGCSVTWHSVRNNVFERTDAIGNVVTHALLTDVDFVTPSLSLATSDGASLFVYSNGQDLFAGRITAGGVVLDTPAVNGGIRVMSSHTSFALQPLAVVNSSFYFLEPASDTNGRLYWMRIEREPKPHVAALIDLHENVTIPVTLTASARNTYLVYSADDDEGVTVPRLFLRTLASPDPQTSPARKRAVR